MHNQTESADSFKERLIMVEQQQSYQKEVLVEINDTLREVVKTQHVLANQRKELDRLTKENEEILRRFHSFDIENAKRKSKEEYQAKLVEAMHTTMKDELKPQHAQVKTYMKIMSGVLAGGWALFLVFAKWWLEG